MKSARSRSIASRILASRCACGSSRWAVGVFVSVFVREDFVWFTLRLIHLFGFGRACVCAIVFVCVVVGASRVCLCVQLYLCVDKRGRACLGKLGGHRSVRYKNK